MSRWATHETFADERFLSLSLVAGIRVMAIAPSLFTTNMGKNTPPKSVLLFLALAFPLPKLIQLRGNRVRESLLSTTLHPVRFGEPEEFAKLAVGIIENGYLNGGSELDLGLLSTSAPSSGARIR